MKRIASLVLLIFAAAVAHATVTTGNLTVSFTCTGSTGPFPFTFPISDPTALTVTQNGTVLSSSAYTMTPVNNNYSNGGSVTLNSSCPNPQPLVLTRISPVTQTSVFTDNMPVPMKTIENGLDKLTEIEQEQSSSLHGLWMLPIYSPTAPSGTCTDPDQVEYVTGAGAPYVQFTCVAGIPPALPQWVQTGGGSTPGTGCAGGNTIPNGCTGATTAAGAEYNLTGLYTVDGSQYASVQAAITACLASANTSCTVDARTSGRLGSAADVIGSFDPGSIGLTLLLGSYTDYTIGQVTLRNNLSIIGAGNILTGITSSSVTNQAVFVLPQANNSPAISVHLEGFGVTPASGATTQIGADLECNSYTNSGMWYSTWDDVWFGNYANGFPGGGIKMSCPTPASAIQFSQFRNVVAFRSSGETNPALSICGSGTGNDQFYGGEFDAGDWSDTTIVPNVFIGACPGDPTGNAYSLNFYGTTMQGGTNLVELNGANTIQFDHTHHEGTPGLTNGFRFVCGGSQNLGIHIDHPAFGNVGTNLATFTGSISGTTLTVSGSVTGTIAVGAALVSTGATGITDGTIILSGSGTTWTINNSQTVSSEAMTATGYTLDTAGGCSTDNVSTDAAGPIVAAFIQSHYQNVVVYGQNGRRDYDLWPDEPPHQRLQHAQPLQSRAGRYIYHRVGCRHSLFKFTSHQHSHHPLRCRKRDEFL